MEANGSTITKEKGKAAVTRKRSSSEPPLPTSSRPKRVAAAPTPPLAAPALLELVIGEMMEVQGCGKDCPFVCTECEWEACTVIADRGCLCEVRITSDGVLCKDVQRRHVRPAARAAVKRAAAAAAREAASQKQARV